jgi:hypothetical protein
VSDHPGCCGTAAKLPKNPGIQKLVPSSSAAALSAAQTVATNKLSFDPLSSLKAETLPKES